MAKSSEFGSPRQTGPDPRSREEPDWSRPEKLGWQESGKIPNAFLGPSALSRQRSEKISLRHCGSGRHGNTPLGRMLCIASMLSTHMPHNQFVYRLASRYYAYLATG